MVPRLLAAVSVVAALVLATAAGAWAQSDDCAGAAYCLPPPPASTVTKKRAQKASRDALGGRVRLADQVGVALLYRGRRAVSVPRKTRRRQIAVPAMAVYCSAPCTLQAGLRLTVGDDELDPPGARLSLQRADAGTIVLRLRRAQLRQIASAGTAELRVDVSVEDEYGTHRGAQTLRVAPRRR